MTARQAVLAPRRADLAPRRDRGSATLEMTVLAPGLLALLSLVIVAGRIVVAHGVVEQASAAAARAASVARTAATAGPAAQAAARDILTGQSLHCSTVSVDVETAGFAVPVGQAADVAVQVTCQVDLASLSLPGMPGSTTLTSTSVSVLDRFRSR